ncbi:MAG TPA: bifunctional diaminohydroxyphosphoribosylaminopyrimidine deaminase/5-amino-6-(5-phosphoribosylamino)uracil reductase RibD [Lentisphaeria bacterium]|nr:MAG: riboflavin biosynthesis protein RibD [Lentisphaerae bacterium GWF2_38_69]HBM15148.1 bifunctional diaminohydroxyphosphoribosylaminopyrimidine deaminase/5-amino-6-(5-phosphoribosylamino)uracil reductase RibD [Lentisphaeria bacterium]
MDNNKFYMQMAIDLAKEGWGRTNPNPLVGAVIVKNDRIIGKGYHKAFGSSHAEIEAIKSISEDPSGSTMYVNLEPCSHYGRTPPCADALVKARFKKIVIGMVDPNPLVSGKGIAILEKNGIEVISGVMEKEAKKLNEIFSKYITRKKPFVIIKSAMTLDGKIASKTGDSKWISNEASRQYVHSIRDRVSSIMIGINTIIHDDPLLTTRLKNKEGKDSIRIVIDSKGRLPCDAKIIRSSKTAPLILVLAETPSEEKALMFQANNIKVIVCPGRNGRVDLSMLMDELYKLQIDSILIEGGGTLNYSSLESGIVDKIMLFISPKIIGGTEAITVFEGKGKERINEAFSLKNIEFKTFEDDILIEGYL